MLSCLSLLHMYYIGLCPFGWLVCDLLLRGGRGLSPECALPEEYLVHNLDDTLWIPSPKFGGGTPSPNFHFWWGKGCLFWKNQHWNGAGSDCAAAAAVRGAYINSAIGRLEGRLGTNVLKACLQAQRSGVGVLPVVAFLISEGAASPQQQKLERKGRLESIFKRQHGRRGRAANARCTAESALHIAPKTLTWETCSRGLCNVFSLETCTHRLPGSGVLNIDVEDLVTTCGGPPIAQISNMYSSIPGHRNCQIETAAWNWAGFFTVL